MRLIAWLMLLVFAAVAAAAEDAETWAKRTIDQGFAILRDDTGGEAGRRARFHAFIVNHVDARKSALFALGVYRKGADPAAIEEYAAVFGDYTIEIYESRLENYKDATLSVTGSIESKPGDVTVNTLGTAPRLREPVRPAPERRRQVQDHGCASRGDLAVDRAARRVQRTPGRERRRYSSAGPHLGDAHEKSARGQVEKLIEVNARSTAPCRVRT